MGVLDVCLLLYILYQNLYNKTHMQSVYNAIYIYIYIYIYILLLLLLLLL